MTRSNEEESAWGRLTELAERWVQARADGRGTEVIDVEMRETAREFWCAERRRRRAESKARKAA